MCEGRAITMPFDIMIPTPIEQYKASNNSSRGQQGPDCFSSVYLVEC